ncbi:hypothetical protein [Kitasatospora phosalacinea]|uniref:hypothetical protein n=1 Tax=Kitasatospora phosalacinea TaxID=2065 RepID=UPI0025522966|nr:hypothetical protein [Kitasatospora phosalacinea]
MLDPADPKVTTADGDVLSHPLRQPGHHRRTGRRSGSFSEEEAQQLAAQLATPALPPGLHPSSTTTPAP